MYPLKSLYFSTFFVLITIFQNKIAPIVCGRIKLEQKEDAKETLKNIRSFGTLGRPVRQLVIEVPISDIHYKTLRFFTFSGWYKRMNYDI